MNTRLLKIAEVAERLSLGRSKTYELIASGAIPSIRISPRIVRVPEDELNEWLKSKEKDATLS